MIADSSVFIFNTFAKMSKNIFLILHYKVLCRLTKNIFVS